MRGILILTMLAASLAYGAANHHVEARDLRLPADDIDERSIDTGAGSLEVPGVADVSEIVVIATITVRTVGGSVSIDDESGSIDVSDVAQDLIIEDDGSGSLTFADIQGRVEIPD